MINTIQGDTFNLMFTVSGNTDTISRLVFSSVDLGVRQDLLRENDRQYLLSIDASTTKTWKVGESTFDITAFFVNGQVRTVLYNSGINVLKKDNGAS